MSHQEGDGQFPDNAPETIAIRHSSNTAPDRIGHYKIQGLIASGGMGTVYRAVQENPRRTVALKVMRAGVTTPTQLHRFEFEAQLLGRLRHPGIAQIFEAGTHREGDIPVPYFAMEYIPNAKDILEYARDRHLGTRERLDLFIRVCEAVHHGHQKGIVHRDLKPGNILVDSNGKPRVIDFGVARAADSDMALTLYQTDVGELVGTVQYMSPEQCDADPHDVDTRSDVYSLGIVLYELLCDRLPYDVHKAPIYEATRVIRSEDPPRPSRINAKLRGDLETIVLKALEKDRDRRYESAAEFAQDLRRYLVGDAISARPASTVYQLRVFARRNKGVLSAVAAVVLVLFAGGIVSGSLYLRNRNYQIQVREQEAKTLGAQNFLQDIMTSLKGTFGDEIKVSKLLEVFAGNIDERFTDQPEAESEVRMMLAQKYSFLTAYTGAVEAGKFADLAQENFHRVLELRRELYGENDPGTTELIEQFADHLDNGFDIRQAEFWYREALRRRENSEDQDPEQMMTLHRRLARVLGKQGKLDQAEAENSFVLQSVEETFGSQSDDMRLAREQQAWIQQLRGELKKAETDRLGLLEEARAPTASDHALEDRAIKRLANLYVSEGRVSEAAAMYHTSLPVTMQRLGVKKWLNEEYSLRPNAPTLLFFWESWCPYCQLNIRELHDILEQNMGPLQVVGMTSLNLGMHEEDAKAFIARNHLKFPNAVYDGKIFKELELGGWPVVVALREGKIVWRGHPEWLSPSFLRGLARDG